MHVIRKYLLVITILAGPLLSKAQELSNIQDLNPRNFNMDFSNYDRGTALFCAELSNLVYDSSEKGKKILNNLKTQYPSENIQYEYVIDNSRKLQVLLLGCKDFVIIAFRGTVKKEIINLITDVKYWNYGNDSTDKGPYKYIPPSYGGFRKMTMRLINKDSLFENLANFIPKCNPTVLKEDFPVFMTGHSLGSALAQLLIKPLEANHFKFMGLYNFAPPLTVSYRVNSEMRKQYESRTFDIVNHKDYVARFGQSYRKHFGKFCRICDNHLIYREPDKYYSFTFLQRFRVLQYHDIENYIHPIKDTVNSNENIVKRSGKECNCFCE